MTTIKRPYRKMPIPPGARWAVWERDNYTCRNCGARRYLTVDHIQPESQNGSLDIANLQTLCKSCNSTKGPYRHRQLKLPRIVKMPSGILRVRLPWRCAGCGTEKLLRPSEAQWRLYCSHSCASRQTQTKGPRPQQWSVQTQEVVRLRQAHPDWTATAIGETVHITRERVRQILKRAGIATEGKITVTYTTLCPQCERKTIAQRVLKRLSNKAATNRTRYKLCSPECRRAHCPPRPLRPSKYDGIKARVVELYQNGMSGPALAEMFRTPKPSIYVILKRCRVLRRPKTKLILRDGPMVWAAHQSSGEGAVRLSRRLGLPLHRVDAILAYYRHDGQQGTS